MKSYEIPEINVIEFGIEDVLTSSNTFNGIPSVGEGDTNGGPY